MASTATNGQRGSYYPGDTPLRRRDHSSMQQVAYRFKQVVDAYRERDEPALRAELNSLSNEALLLAASDPICR